MDSTVAIWFSSNCCARGVVVSAWADLPAAVQSLGIAAPRPVVVVVGGADLADRDLTDDVVLPAFSAGLVPAMVAVGAIGVDGGTDSGVIRVFGMALAQDKRRCPLIGVVAAGTVRLPDDHLPSADRLARAELEPHHSHFVLVPGGTWGDESRWLARTASLLAGRQPSLTVVANGGEIAYADVGHSVAEGRSVIVLGGSGRTADDLAAAASGRPASRRAQSLAESGLIVAHDVADHDGLAALMADRLTTGGGRSDDHR